MAENRRYERKWRQFDVFRCTRKKSTKSARLPYRTTKPSRGWLRVAYLKAHVKKITQNYAQQTGARSKFIFLCLGCTRPPAGHRNRTTDHRRLPPHPRTPVLVFAVTHTGELVENPLSPSPSLSRLRRKLPCLQHTTGKFALGVVFLSTKAG